MSQGNAPIILLSELFPPAVGGSSVLFANVYSRITTHSIQVLTDVSETATPEWDAGFAPMSIVREPLRTRAWGIRDIAALRHHYRVARSIKRLMGRRRGVVHCGRSLPEGAAALAARVSGGPPYLCWTHGEDITMATTSTEFRLLTRLIYRFAGAAIANSRNTAEVLSGIGVKSDKVTIVYPGVDPQRFHPEVDGRSIRERIARPGDFVMLSVGRLQKRKGHDVAIAAVAALAPRLPELRYVIVGTGEERQSLEALVAEHRIGDRVTFLGEIADSELPACYAACNLFVLPNRIERGDIEGFGIVFLEAAATARPTIGGRSGGVPEAIAEGLTGCLVSGTNVTELAETIEQLARNPARCAQMGLAGRQRVIDSFTWSAAAAKIAAVHERIAHGGYAAP